MTPKSLPTFDIDMASRLMNTPSIFLHSASPAISLSHFPVRRGLCHSVAMSSSSLTLSLAVPTHCMPVELRWKRSSVAFRPLARFEPRLYSTLGLFELIKREVKAMQLNANRVRSTPRNVLSSKEEVLLNTEIKKHDLEKGILLEFQKDSNKTLLAVVQKPDGKKNWMVSDQNGVTFSIKPQQIKYIIPGTKDFEPADIADFLHRAKHLLDPSLLECAWEELLENEQIVNAEGLAEIIYGKTDPLESYCAHVLLSQDEVHFKVRESKGYSSVYEPRSLSQVDELSQRKEAKESYQRELEAFICVLKSAKEQPIHAKPSKYSWQADDKIQHRIEALEAFALDACKSDEQKRTATEVLKALGIPRFSSSAVDLLINIGYFPVHVNLELLKFEIPTKHSDEVLSLVSDILEHSLPDQDEHFRKDLTYLKVYAIDVDEADELDDALSAEKLPDGRIKVWIHVADATRWVDHNSILIKEAKSRATSVFLPTETIPMFPLKLAMEKMSLKQGIVCNTVSISVVLNEDGSIAEHNIEVATIRPTYMMTYDEASELLFLGIEEEPELGLLSEAAVLRLKWRLKQGAIDTPMIDARVKVPNPDDPEPIINLYLHDPTSPAMRLVSEMMIMCGEAIAKFGGEHGIPLPYRGQSQSSLAAASLSYLPEGPARSSAYVRSMRRVEMDFRRPIPHGSLRVPGYVQFTSPIRRYVDLLAHYQVKAHLRGEMPPFTSTQLEGIMPTINMQVRISRRICNNSVRYWILEYLRRQPKGKEFRALILRFVKDKIATLLLLEVGIQGSVEVYSGAQVGDEIMICVLEAHPRKDTLSFEEVNTL
ncbi:ribonuclease II, chloroplastic/mitochondrial isoform X1 [Cryptomeria japonica]|uniref:ribonuclease II, chloroplastic/mitochondrial isoform X1 n=1 Tax=Cryptomeria japonica TaxID=3369 RepID=UPI0027DAB260|nr:ribonuclease II, chloroplastic/mitochondrial isoform X1 [Cryptomeria japonica]XP_057838681.2 ribonuclease II, chloroplastic/mitochondrial isoform X1 [Cryptomeria japonica]